MFDLQITNVHRFYHVPTRFQKLCKWPGMLIFVIDGLEFQKMIFPDGTYGPVPNPAKPFIQFLKEGTMIDYKFNINRKWWGFRFDAPKIEYDSNKTHVEITCDEANLRFPLITHIPQENVYSLTTKFEQMRELYLEPTAQNKFKLHHLAYDILYYLLEHNEKKRANSPTAKFKQLLNEDIKCEWTLEALSRRCGYSKDHMRRMFFRDYSITPQEYRNQIRKGLIEDYLINSDLSIKEISNLAGFEYESYLCKFFAKQSNMSPTEYRKKHG